MDAFDIPVTSAVLPSALESSPVLPGDPPSWRHGGDGHAPLPLPFLPGNHPSPSPLPRYHPLLEPTRPRRRTILGSIQSHPPGRPGASQVQGFDHPPANGDDRNFPHDPDGGVRVQRAPRRVFDSGEDPHDPGSEVRGATGTGDLKGTLRYERGCCGTNRSARRTGRAPTRTSAAAAGVRGAQGSTREERDLRDTDHRGRRPDGRESRCSGSPSIRYDVRRGSDCDHAPASTRIWTRETYHVFPQQFMPAGASGPPRTSRVVASSRAPQEPLEPAGPPAGPADRNFVLDA
jgi:hypothetical protein